MVEKFGSEKCVGRYGWRWFAGRPSKIARSLEEFALGFMKKWPVAGREVGTAQFLETKS